MIPLARELDRAKRDKAQRAKWRVTHVAGADGRCVECGRLAPCLYATAGRPAPTENGEQE